MAYQDKWVAFLNIGDSREKITPVEFYVSAADAVLYLEAAAGAARAATDVGVLIAAAFGLSDGTLMSQGVRLVQEDDTAVFPPASAEVYNFDKLATSYQAGFKNYSQSIPARDMAAVTVESDGVTVIIGASGSGEVQAFEDAFNDTALGENGASATLRKMYVRS